MPMLKGSIFCNVIIYIDLLELLEILEFILYDTGSVFIDLFIPFIFGCFGNMLSKSRLGAFSIVL